MAKEQFLMVPEHILKLKNLDGDNKLLLAKIISLHKLENGCIMSNGYIGKMLGLDKSSASRRISKLIKLNYIETQNIYKDRVCIGRKIIPTIDRGIVLERLEGGVQVSRGVVFEQVSNISSLLNQ
jgi:DNA-binding Lrp family transcriptional regulator